MKILSIIASVIVVLSTTGCLSSAVYQQSQQRVALRKAIIANDQRAINAIKLGDDGVGIGINVLALEALSEQPLKQLGAAVGDALLIWGAYEGVTWAVDEINGNDNQNQDSGRDSNVLNITGDGNDVHVGDETSDQTSGQN